MRQRNKIKERSEEERVKLNEKRALLINRYNERLGKLRRMRMRMQNIDTLPGVL